MAGSPRLAMPVFERRCMKRPMSSPAQCGSKAERDLEKARVHPIAIELDLVCPLITRRHLFHQLGELRSNPLWEGLGGYQTFGSAAVGVVMPWHPKRAASGRVVSATVSCSRAGRLLERLAHHLPVKLLQDSRDGLLTILDHRLDRDAAMSWS